MTTNLIGTAPDQVPVNGFLGDLAYQTSTSVKFTGGTLDNITIGGTTPAAGSFTTLSASSTVTLSGGTANGVLYLNGSKAATSGSALTFDGTNLGIGTSSPACSLDVQKASGTVYAQVKRASQATGEVGIHIDGGTSGVKWDIYQGASSNLLRFYVDGATAGDKMALSSNGTFRVTGAGTSGSTDAVQFSGSAPASSMSLDSYGNLHIPGGGGISTNEAFGKGALRNNTTGSNNTAIGLNALLSNTTGSYNTASGMNALQNSGKTVTAGSFVVGVSYTIQSIGTTDFTLIGAASNTIGVVFTATGVGTGTGTASSNTNNNSAFGQGALYNNTTGSNNTASGLYALFNNTTGYQNTASGVSALYANTTGVSNTASGVYSLYANTTGVSNTASGMNALQNSGKTVTAGSFVVGIAYTIQSIGTTDFTLIGAASNTVGLVFTTTGVGTGTGTASSNTNNNTAIGYSAGSNLTTGANNTVIGANASASSATVNNEITLGNSTQTMLRMPPVIKGYTSAAPTIASATTIAPTTPIVFVSGTTAIATITAPAPISSGGGQITIIPTGLFTTTTAGNIALATTAVVSKALIMTYDATTAKWYPSY